MRYVLLGCFLLLSVKGWSQLVNIESRRLHTDSIRHAGNAQFAGAYTENANVEVFALKTALALQLKSKDLKNIFFMLGNADITRVNGNDAVNATFLHLRYNYKISRVIRLEVFNQLQNNKLLQVGTRWLAGVGPRFKLMDDTHVHAYLGTLYMHEFEKVTGEFAETNRDHRLSSYLTVTLSFPESPAELISTAYYQPKFNIAEDYRLTWQTALTFQVSKRLRWVTSFNYFYDAFPPAGIPGRAISIDQGLRMDF